VTEEAKKEFLEITDRLAELEKKRHELRRERRMTSDRVSVIRAELMIDIAKARDEKGKPIYSNENLRRAALTLRMEENEEYQGLKERQRDLDDELATLAIEHNRLEARRGLLALEMGLIRPSSPDGA
jgi:phosphoglycerate-specific signal transduction histidine kinase